MEPNTTFRALLEDAKTGREVVCNCVYKGEVGSWLWKKYIVENLDFENESVRVTGDEDIEILDDTWVMRY